MKKQEELLLGDKLRLAWYFEKPYEKIILFLAFVTSLYAIIRILFQGFW